MFGVALGYCLIYVPLHVLLCLILAAILLTTGERWGRLTAGEGALLYGALLGGVLLWVASVCGGSGSLLPAVDGQGPGGEPPGRPWVDACAYAWRGGSRTGCFFRAMGSASRRVSMLLPEPGIQAD